MTDRDPTEGPMPTPRGTERLPRTGKMRQTQDGEWVDTDWRLNQDGEWKHKTLNDWDY